MQSKSPSSSVEATDTDPTALAALPLALLDEIEHGLLVCTAQSKLLFANQAANHELESAALLTVQSGQLRLAARAQGALVDALHLAADSGRRSLVRIASGDDRLLATVMPLKHFLDSNPMVLVMLGRRRTCTELGLELLASSHGLTLAERRVLAALVREESPKEIAVAHAVSISTVRTQITAIRAKFGTRSIEGLLLRTAEVPPVAPRVRSFGSAVATLAHV